MVMFRPISQPPLRAIVDEFPAFGSAVDCKTDFVGKFSVVEIVPEWF